MKSTLDTQFLSQHALSVALALAVGFVPFPATAQATEASPPATSKKPQTADSANAETANDTAQGESSGEPGEQNADDDVIIVTAQKRAANIQDVPLSVAAIDGSTIENMGLESTSDIARLTPGVAVSTTGPSRTQIVMRGISSTAGSQATVGFYLDELPVSALAQNIEASLFDLDRVEILRGPQGTLYGSSSMGGAIKYISNQPRLNKTEARGDLTISQTDSGGTNFAANAVVNLPLAQDLAALRVVGFYKSEDGYIDRYEIDRNNYLSIDPTTKEKNVNSYDIWGFRASLRVTPTDSLRITPSVYYQKLGVDGFFAFDDPPGSYSNMVQARLVPDFEREELTIYNLTAVQKLGADLDLTSSSSYFVRDTQNSEDTSRALFFLGTIYFPGVQPTAFPLAETEDKKTKLLTQELRLSGEVGPFEFVAGGYYQKKKSRRVEEIPLTAEYNETFGSPFPGFDTMIHGDVRVTAEEVAAFGQVTWHVSDRLRLTGGLRQFNLRERSARIASGVFNGGVTENSGKSSAKGLTPKFAVDFDVNEDVLLYATAAKGFRAGGALIPVPETVCGPFLADLGLTGAPTEYQPDSLWNYEVGVKSQFADRRVTLNASAYHVDWARIQQALNLQCGFGFTANFGSAVSRGFEIESRFRPSDSLTLGLNLGYTDAYLTETVPGTTGKEGDRLLNVPKYTFSGVINYEQPLSNRLVGFVSSNYSYTSKVLAEYNEASPWNTRKAYNIIDFRVGVYDERWRLSLFVDNLLNTHATVGNAFSVTGVTIPTTRALSVNRPRTIGLNLKTSL